MAIFLLKMNEFTQILIDSINSEFLKKRLDEINKHLYNRKQEGQIRDALLFDINNGSKLKGLSEFPKKCHGAVDLTLFSEGNRVATIEFKHHYPGDLHLKSVIDSIIKDIGRVVEVPTSHFVLIIQEREIEEPNEILCELNYMNRNGGVNLDILEEYIRKIKCFTRHIKEITIGDSVRSKYTFVVYELCNT